MLILLRHGRTAINADQRVQGQVDARLDAVGQEQARLAGNYLRRRFNIARVVTSPLSRAVETLEGAGFGNKSIETDKRWAEIDFGDYDRRKYEEVIGELTTSWRADISYTPPGGESMAELHSRVAEASVDLLEQSANEDILVVTHATPIKSAVVWALGGDAPMILNLWVNLGTVSVLGLVRGQPVLAGYNSDPLTETNGA